MSDRSDTPPEAPGSGLSAMPGELEAAALTQAEYRALSELRYEIRRFLRFSEQAARQANVEPQQHQTLLAIKGLPEDKSPTIGEVAERLQIQHQSAVEMVDRLEERGLLERYKQGPDRRQVFLRLTPRAEKLLADLSKAHQAELRAIGPSLVQALNALLREE